MKNPKPELLRLPRSKVELITHTTNYEVIVVTNYAGQSTMMTYTELKNISDYMKEPDRTQVVEWLVTYLQYMESDAD